MKVIEFKEIENSSYFWLFFLSTAFPLAYDKKEDIDLAEFIYENYDIKAADVWINEFVQYHESIIQDNDGYAENPTAIVIEKTQIHTRFNITPEIRFISMVMMKLQVLERIMIFIK